MVQIVEYDNGTKTDEGRSSSSSSSSSSTSSSSSSGGTSDINELGHDEQLNQDNDGEKEEKDDVNLEGISVPQRSGNIGKELLDEPNEGKLQKFLVYGDGGDGITGWEKEVDKWAVAPRISMGLSYGDNKKIYPSEKKQRKGKDSKLEVGRFEMEIFFASVIEMLCDGEFDGLQARLREVLKQIAGHFIHSSYLSEAFGTIRIAVRKRITETLRAATNINIDDNLTVYTPNNSSRYSNDFKEVGRIGYGGFGQVFQVHSYMDACDYAIKKIHFDLSQSLLVKKIFNEVRMLAALKHRNIVRYYGAWTELQHPQSQSSLKNCDNSTKKDEDKYKDSPESAESSLFSSTAGPKLIKKGSAIMFVQMELCSRSLKDYFDVRNGEKPPKINRQLNKSIMQQLMSAVAHLHSKQIIHRDIKPGNIFLCDESSSSMPRVLLGDFGLACEHHTTEGCGMPKTNDENKNNVVTKHSRGVGTSIYAAPEQRKSSIYNDAVDIYSAGIVFFELCVPFFTHMERYCAIAKLRTGKMSKGFRRSFPNESKLIRQMCMKEPEKRPHAFEIVKKLGEMDENLQPLKDHIQELEKEIARLKKLLLDNNIADV